MGLCCKGYAAGAMLHWLCCRGYTAGAMLQELCCRGYAAGLCCRGYAAAANTSSATSQGALPREEGGVGAACKRRREEVRLGIPSLPKNTREKPLRLQNGGVPVKSVARGRQLPEFKETNKLPVYIRMYKYISIYICAFIYKLF